MTGSTVTSSGTSSILEWERAASGACSCTDFPVEAVLASAQRVGKAGFEPSFLDALERADTILERCPEPRPDVGALRGWIGMLLDKRRGVYDYNTYIAIEELEAAPAIAGFGETIATLTIDLLRFELGSFLGTEDRLPVGRPPRSVVATRVRVGRTIPTPYLSGWSPGPFTDADLDDPAPVLAELEALWDARPIAVRDLVRHSMVPVSLVHDEYLFIRVLQTFETVFGIVRALLREAADAVRQQSPEPAAAAVRAAAFAWRHAMPVFRVLATMSPANFHSFRRHTDGASAIQSRAFKEIELLCDEPTKRRMDSPAFDANPDLRTRSTPSLRTLVADAAVTELDRMELLTALHTLDEAYLGWKRAHRTLAARMLNGERGTGGTPGVPYLSSFANDSLFTPPLEEDACGSRS